MRTRLTPEQQAANEASCQRLRQAIMDSDMELLRSLLAEGLNPSLPNRNGQTAVYWAAKQGNTWAAQILLAAGASPDGHKGCHPIVLAVGTSGTKMLTALLSAGAKTDVTTSCGENLLHLAARSSQAAVQLLLRVRVPLNAADREGNTPLHVAVCNNAAMTRHLIKRGANMEARTNHGFTPLLTAALKGELASVQALLAAGADPLARDAQGRSAFDLALVHDNADTALHMLEYHPATAPTGKALDEVLVKAVVNGWAQMARRLASLGANLDQRPGGRTLLQCAPRDSEDLKRLLRSHKMTAAIASAMDADADPAPPAPSRSPVL